MQRVFGILNRQPQAASSLYLNHRINRLRYKTSHSMRRDASSSNFVDPQLGNGASELKRVEDLPGGRSRLSILLRLLMSGGVGKGIFHMHESAVKQHGLIMKGKEGSTYAVFLADPAEIHKLYEKEPQYPTRGTGDAMKRLLKENPNIKPGVFFSNGPDWYKYRSLLSKKLLRPLEVKLFLPRLRDITVESISRFDRLQLASGNKGRFEVKALDEELFLWSFESVTSVLFDRRLGALQTPAPPNTVAYVKNVGTFLKSIFEMVFIPPILFKLYTPKVYKRCRDAYTEMNEFGINLIEEALKEVEQQKKEDKSSKLIPYLLNSGNISREDLAWSISDLLFAGVDTTSNSLLWALYLLAKNKKPQAVLRDEIKRTFSKYGEIDNHALSEMPYLRAVIKETLRLYPVVLVTGRRIQSDKTFRDCFVPSGTGVNILHWPASRSKESFTSPEQFKPERWLHRGETPLFASLPFGHGKRMCLGRRLAVMEMSLFLSYLLRSYSLDYPEGEIVKPYARGVVVPDRPLRVQFLREG